MMISVIVPIYNGEKYIRKTIDSLLNQKYDNIELILVNDGSTDNSLKICEEYSAQDSRIVIINKQNEGISAARNSGLEIAKGDYISFIDQDDEITDDIYTKLVGGFSEQIDFVVSGKVMKLIDSESRVIQDIVYEYNAQIISDQFDILKLLLNVNRNTCLLHIWNCLYKHSIIIENKLSFDKTLKYGHEDSLFNIQYVSKCKKIRVLSGVVYYYFRRAASSTSLKKNLGYIKDFQRYALVTSKSLSEVVTKKKEKAMLYTYLLRLGISLFSQYSLKQSDRKKELYQIYNICKKYSRSNIVSYRGINKIYAIYLNVISLLLKYNNETLAIIAVDLLRKQ